MSEARWPSGHKVVPIADRFWAKVQKGEPEACWAWTGSTDPRGRGQMYADGRLQNASRIAWRIVNGRELTRAEVACHSCDNPRCVNPAHIFAGTQSDNMRDMAAKGRMNDPGFRRKWSVSMTPEQRRAIVDRYRSGETKTQIAREQNVCRAIVTKLLKREGAHV